MTIQEQMRKTTGRTVAGIAMLFLSLFFVSCDDSPKRTVPMQRLQLLHAPDGALVSVGSSLLNVSARCTGEHPRSDQRHQLCVCAKQTLEFYHEGKRRTVGHPVEAVPQVLDDGTEVMMLENLITEVGILGGTNGYIYSVQGHGGCNACPEWFGLYSLDGTLLWHTYNTRSEVISNSGSFEAILAEYGIDPKEYSGNQYPKISCAPCE